MQNLAHSLESQKLVHLQNLRKRLSAIRQGTRFIVDESQTSFCFFFLFRISMWICGWTRKWKIKVSYWTRSSRTNSYLLW